MYIHHLFQQNHVKTDSFFWNIVPDHQFLFLEILFLFIFFKSIYFVFFYFFKNKYTKNKFTNVTNIKIQQNVYKIRK